MINIKKNEEIINFFKTRQYEMINDDLGKGSFGKTVLIKDPFIDELFVAKKYEPQKEEIKNEFYKNFIEEIKILYKLNHKNIVRIFNYYPYESKKTGYIIMEYIQGKTIDKYFQSYNSDSVILFDDIFSQIIDAFICIEQSSIIHRDIRPSNIMITDNNIVKVIDFGIGKNIDYENYNIHDSLKEVINRPHTYLRNTIKKYIHHKQICFI